MFELQARPNEGSAGGACYFCKLADADGFIRHPLISIDYEGDPLICTNCVREMAKLIGWYSPKSRENLLREIGELKAKNSELEPKAEGFRIFVEKLEEARSADTNVQLESLVS